jgi:hypothetical protein
MTSKINDKPGCLSAILTFFKRPKEKPSAEALPYRLRDDFLSPAEFSFYKVLNSIVGNQRVIQSKVRLADVFFVARPNENIAYLNKIAQRHLDFLVCDATTMQPILGIELDDGSHQRSDRRERDSFVEQVFQAAGLPLLRVPVRHTYNSREIEDLITPLFKNRESAQGIAQPVVNPTVASPPLCPKCGIPMVIRTVAQGEYKGKQFYGCQNYPRCREM